MVVVGVHLAGVAVALALALNDEAEDARGDGEDARQVVVVVDGQQVAVPVRVADVELDAAEAVQTLHQLVELFELAGRLAVEAEATELGVVFALDLEDLLVACILEHCLFGACVRTCLSCDSVF